MAPEPRDVHSDACLIWKSSDPKATCSCGAVDKKKKSR